MKKGLLLGLILGISFTAFAKNNFADSVKVTNAGYNGNNTADLLLRLDKDVLSKNPDVVILMVGTNDMLNQRNKLPLKQYRENYQQLISRIKKKAKLFIMTIPPVNPDYIIARQDPKIYAKVSPVQLVDSANMVIKELAAKNKIHLIDLNRVLTACGGSTTAPESLFQNEVNFKINDGVHPTANGYKVIGTAVYEAVSTQEPKAKVVVCFGDSITFGYKMNGQGKVTGDCYPAVLNRLYNQ